MLNEPQYYPRHHRLGDAHEIRRSRRLVHRCLRAVSVAETAEKKENKILINFHNVRYFDVFIVNCVKNNFAKQIVA